MPGDPSPGVQPPSLHSSHGHGWGPRHPPIPSRHSPARMGGSGLDPSRGQSDSHVWTPGWAPGTSFLEAPDGDGRMEGEGRAGWIYSPQSKPRLRRRDGRRVGARAPPARPAHLACLGAAGGDKGTPGTLRRICPGAGMSRDPTAALWGRTPRLRTCAANRGQGSSRGSQEGARPPAVSPQHSGAEGLTRARRRARSPGGTRKARNKAV